MENDWKEQRSQIIGLGENSFKKSYYPELQLKISELEASNKILQKREALLNEIQQLTKVGGWEYDIHSGKSFWTDELYRLHEIPNDSDIDHLDESQKFYSPKDKQTISDAFNRACKYGEAYDLEFPFTTFKGKHLWIRTTAQAVYEENEIVRVVGNIMDITERKGAEEEIRKLNQELEKRVIERTSQLEAANKELEAFSYSVSHDLRAPLRHINGYIDLLKKRFPESLPEKGQEFLNNISESVIKMGELIDDLLQFSRTGRLELKYSKLNMNSLVEESVREVKFESVGRNIEWIINPLPVVLGDGNLLKLVWTNLLSNATKFTRKKEKAIIEIECKDSEMEYIFSVRDNGVGFDMQYAQKLFGVFQRLHSTADYEGTGIGLANVQRIINRHGGRVWAEAEVEKGAIFYFALPKNKNQP